MDDNQNSICEVCGKGLSSNSALYKHLRKVHDIQPETGKPVKSEASGDFKCFLCDKFFAQKWSVTRHLQDIHQVEVLELPEEKSAAFKCDQCPKSYLQKKDLNYHLKKKHPSEPLSGNEDDEPFTIYECELCCQKFTLRSSVVRHLKKVHGIVSPKSEDGERFSCEFCGKSYKHRKDLYVHIRTKHSDTQNIDADAEDDLSDSRKAEKERLSCPECTNTYSCKFTLERHIQKHHSEVAAEYLKDSGSYGVCPLCDAYVRHGENIILHLQQAHEVNMETENMHFSSIEEFNRWKDQMCNDTLTQYAKVRGDADVCNGQRMFLNCRSSGKYRPQGKGLRYRDPERIVKTGKVCPARLVVTTTLEGVDVVFHKTHVGHDNSLTYLMFTKSEREEIADTEVPIEMILDKIASKAPSQKRDAIDVQDLYNVPRDANKGHKDDAIGVDVWVDQQHCLGDESPIQFYKRHGDIDAVYGLDKNDFVLVIMTPHQKRMLQKFAPERILIDSTHGTNQYYFQLTTLMSVDEFGAGVPLAFCISNRINEVTMKSFFESVKEAAGGRVDTEVFMSDDYAIYYSAWCDVMRKPTYRLLCLWHIQKNWKKYLTRLVKDQMKQAEVYRSLQVLLVEMDEEVFIDTLDGFLEMCQADEATREFGEYFIDTYASRPEMWAFVYRKGLRLNSNMYLEAMHKKLKYIYMDGKTNRRLEKCIAALLRFSASMIQDRFVRLVKRKPNYRMKLIMKSHKTSLDISEEMISTVQENVWLVQSSEAGNDEVYKVVVDDKSQCHGCPLSCWVCRTCIHKFACTCKDYLIRGNFCEHIHACLRIKGYTEEVVKSESSGESEQDVFAELEALAEDAPPTGNVDEVLEKRQKLATLLNTSVEISTQLDNAHVIPVIEGVERLLNNLKTHLREAAGNAGNHGTSRSKMQAVCYSKDQTTTTPIAETSQVSKRHKGETTSIQQVKYEVTNFTTEEESQNSPRERLNSLFDELYEVCSQLSDGSSIRKGITEVQHFLKSVLLGAAKKSDVFSSSTIA